MLPYQVDIYYNILYIYGSISPSSLHIVRMCVRVYSVSTHKTWNFTLCQCVKVCVLLLFFFLSVLPEMEHIHPQQNRREKSIILRAKQRTYMLDVLYTHSGVGFHCHLNFVSSSAGAATSALLPLLWNDTMLVLVYNRVFYTCICAFMWMLLLLLLPLFIYFFIRLSIYLYIFGKLLTALLKR